MLICTEQPKTLKIIFFTLFPWTLSFYSNIVHWLWPTYFFWTTYSFLWRYILPDLLTVPSNSIHLGSNLWSLLLINPWLDSGYDKHIYCIKKQYLTKECHCFTTVIDLALAVSAVCAFWAPLCIQLHPTTLAECFTKTWMPQNHRRTTSCTPCHRGF